MLHAMPSRPDCHPRRVGPRVQRLLMPALLAHAVIATAAAGDPQQGGAEAWSAMPWQAPAGVAAPAFTPVAMHAPACCFATTLASADLDGDGDADLVVGNGMSYDVSVLLAEGVGRYAPALNLPLWAMELGHVAVAIGDLDGDGHPDIAAAGVDASHIQLFIGDGSGGFTAGALLDIGASGAWPRALAIADVDGDGDADLVGVNNDSASISVILADGAGGFATAQGFATGAFPVALALGDVDGDGDLDVATANAGGRDASLLLGNGSGGFAAPVALALGSDAEPNDIALADADGDGDLDILTANTGSDGSPFPPPELPGSISLLAGDGSGAFAAGTTLALGGGEGRADGIGIGDVTGDGLPDIVASRPNANAVSVIAGTAGGGFGAAFLRPVGVGPNPLVLADVSADGIADIVVANAVGPNVSMLPGAGVGGVGFAGRHPAGRFPHGVTAADFDGDGHVDVATANAFGDDVSVLRNDGNGGFLAAQPHAVGVSPTHLVAGDVNGDGAIDLLSANLGGGDVSVLLGDGAGGFGVAQSFPVSTGFESPYALALGDANGDGRLDVATANTNISNDSLSLLLGDGSGGFAAAIELPLGAPGYYSPQGIVFADVTGDGHDDIVSANSGANNLSLLAGDGSGGFAAPLHLAVDGGPVIVHAADLDGDGHLDLVTANQWGQSAAVLLSDGAGGFAPAVAHAIYPPQSVQEFDAWPWGLALGDVTGDGLPDIVTANTQNDTISVLPNDGNGGFPVFAWFATGAQPGSVTIADLDGDGRNDIVSANRANDDIAVLRNASAGDAIFADGFDGG